MQRLEDADRRRGRDQGSKFHFMLSPLGALPRFSDQDTLCSDELRIELGLAVFKQHFDDFSQFGVQLVERRCLRVRTGGTGHMSNEQPSLLMGRVSGSFSSGASAASAGYALLPGKHKGRIGMGRPWRCAIDLRPIPKIRLRAVRCMIGMPMRLHTGRLHDGLRCLIVFLTLGCALTAGPTTSRPAAETKRELVATARWLHFPVKTGAPKREVTLTSKGLSDYRFEIELADGDADWWAPLDLSRWRGRSITVSVNQLPDGSRALRSLRLSDEIIGKETLYREPLRPQFHFSARRGWNNDPNGLAFYNGEYHLFFQHNPYGWDWGNMHWGHATSRDLVHWREHGDVLFLMPWARCSAAALSWTGGTPAASVRERGRRLSLIYTAAGSPATQCLAFSVDGRSFTKYNGNPVLRQITREIATRRSSGTNRRGGG